MSLSPCGNCGQERTSIDDGYSYRGKPVCKTCFGKLYPIKDAKGHHFGSWEALKRLGVKPIAKEIPLKEWPVI